jgi:hypothetical protein
MKVAIVRGGGVAGLTSRTRLTSEALPAADSEAFEKRVRESGLLTMPEEPARRPQHPDELLYAITVEEGDLERTLRFTDEGLPEAVRSLVDWVDGRPEAEHGAGPPG